MNEVFAEYEVKTGFELKQWFIHIVFIRKLSERTISNSACYKIYNTLNTLDHEDTNNN
jgi:hypothetical protein